MDSKQIKLEVNASTTWLFKIIRPVMVLLVAMKIISAKRAATIIVSKCVKIESSEPSVSSSETPQEALG